MLSVLSRGRLTTLLFHRVPKNRDPLRPDEQHLEDFSLILESTLRYFRIIPLEDAIRGLRAGLLPPRSACLTFDDGYSEWATDVVPVLERAGVHATFFVTVGQLSGQPLWSERIAHAVRAASPTAGPLSWRGLPDLKFATMAERQQSLLRLDSFLKYQDPSIRDQLILQLENHVGTCASQAPVMTVDQLRQIHAKGFGIGAHAISHPILSRCNAKRAYEEIAGAREELAALIRGPITGFAYPNGRPLIDFDADHVEMVRRAGYSYALTTGGGVATQRTSLFQIPRFTPWGRTGHWVGVRLIRNLTQSDGGIPEEKPSGKRVLMTAFHYPPQSGSSGVLRTLNFTRNLPERGWTADVLTARASAYEAVGLDLIDQIPAGTRVARAYALDAARDLSIRGKYPRSLALPDRWSSWVLSGLLKGWFETRRSRPDVLWSTYPIASAHLIAGLLSRLRGLPWIADFRDPLVDEGHEPRDLLERTQRRLEQWVMANASACVFVTEDAARLYAQRYPAMVSKIVVIENGYDETIFERVTAVRNTGGRKWLLLHSGVIYPRERDPSTFFEAVRQLIDAKELSPAQLCIRFRASGHDREILSCALRYGLQDCVETAPPIPYEEAIAEMMGADLLLVFQGVEFNRQIPAKLYEYLRAARPVLGIVDPTGSTAARLRTFSETFTADISSVHEISDALCRFFSRCQTESEAMLSGFGANMALIRRYSRASQAGQLADLLDQCRRQPTKADE